MTHRSRRTRRERSKIGQPEDAAVPGAVAAVDVEVAEAEGEDGAVGSRWRKIVCTRKCGAGPVEVKNKRGVGTRTACVTMHRCCGRRLDIIHFQCGGVQAQWDG